jgi:hypothetical protein
VGLAQLGLVAQAVQVVQQVLAAQVVQVEPLVRQVPAVLQDALVLVAHDQVSVAALQALVPVQVASVRLVRVVQLVVAAEPVRVPQVLSVRVAQRVQARPASQSARNAKNSNREAMPQALVAH